MISWWSNNFGEECANAAYSAIMNKSISQGSITRRLEEKVSKDFGVTNVIAMNSGSTALFSILHSLDIPSEAEIIIQSRTWIATLNAALMCNKNVKIVDVAEDSYCVTLKMLKEKMSDKTTAIIITHMNGRSYEFSEIASYCKARGIFLIEDAAQAIYSKSENKFLGTFGDASIFSLGVTKIISSGQGGLALVKDDYLAKKIRNFRTQGVESTLDPTFWPAIGCNFRFTDVLASIALVQFGQAAERVEKSNEIYEKYLEVLADCKSLKLMKKNSPAEVQTYVEVLCQDRDGLYEFLKFNNIESRKFYPPANEAEYLNKESDCKVSDVLAKKGLYLPSGPGQNIKCIDLVARCIHKFEKQ